MSYIYSKPQKKYKLSWLLFLGVLPFEKAALTLYQSSSIGEYISYFLNAAVICCLALVFIVRPLRNDHIRAELTIKYIFYFGVLLLVYIFGAAGGEFSFSRLLSMGCLLGYYLLIIYIYRDVHRLLEDIYKAMFFIVFLSFILYILGSEDVLYIEHAYSTVFKGIALNRNSYSEITLFFVAIGFYFYKEKKKFIYIVGIVMAIYTTLITKGAGSIICMVLLCVLWLFGESKYGRLLCSLNTFAALYLAVFVVIVVNRFTDFRLFTYVSELFGKGMTLTGRLNIWNLSIELINQVPVFGSGYDNVLLLQEGIIANDPHNGILYTLLTQGIVGLMALVAMLVPIFRDSTNQSLRADSAYFAMLTFVVVWMLRGLIESPFSYSHFVFWCAVIVMELIAKEKARELTEKAVSE